MPIPSSSSVGTGGPSGGQTHPGPDTPLLETATTTVSSVTVTPSVVPAVVQGSVNLLDWEDHSSAPVPASTPALVTAPVQLFLPFQADRMTPALFQQHFTTLPEGFNGRLCLLSHLPSQGSEFEALFRLHHIFVLASGPLPAPTSGHKFFLYAHQRTQSMDLLGGLSGGSDEEGCFVAQVLVLSTTQEVQVLVKATPNLLISQTNPALAYKCFLDKLVEALQPLRPQIV